MSDKHTLEGSTSKLFLRKKKKKKKLSLLFIYMRSSCAVQAPPKIYIINEEIVAHRTMPKDPTGDIVLANEPQNPQTTWRGGELVY